METKCFAKGCFRHCIDRIFIQSIFMLPSKTWNSEYEFERVSMTRLLSVIKKYSVRLARS